MPKGIKKHLPKKNASSAQSLSRGAKSGKKFGMRFNTARKSAEINKLSVSLSAQTLLNAASRTYKDELLAVLVPATDFFNS